MTNMHIINTKETTENDKCRERIEQDNKDKNNRNQIIYNNISIILFARSNYCNFKDDDDYDTADDAADDGVMLIM